MKQRPITALQRWMFENRYSDPAFAEAVNAVLARRGITKTISKRSVARWRRGEGAVPRAHVQGAIMELTEGAVTPTNLLEDAIRGRS